MSIYWTVILETLLFGSLAVAVAVAERETLGMVAAVVVPLGSAVYLLNGL